MKNINKKKKMVKLDIELDDDVYLALMKIANGRDITIEYLIVEILTDYVRKKMKRNKK